MDRYWKIAELLEATIRRSTVYEEVVQQKEISQTIDSR